MTTGDQRSWNRLRLKEMTTIIESFFEKPLYYAFLSIRYPRQKKGIYSSNHNQYFIRRHYIHFIYLSTDTSNVTIFSQVVSPDGITLCK